MYLFHFIGTTHLHLFTTVVLKARSGVNEYESCSSSSLCIQKTSLPMLLSQFHSLSSQWRWICDVWKWLLSNYSVDASIHYTQVFCENCLLISIWLALAHMLHDSFIKFFFRCLGLKMRCSPWFSVGT